VERAELIRNSKRICDNVLITIAEEELANMRVIASRTADEMLNLSGVKAAFVIYPHENSLCVSARSLGDVNVQLILDAEYEYSESLGVY
jgi:c-di-AMP phosphodiesterase-like protein